MKETKLFSWLQLVQGNKQAQCARLIALCYLTVLLASTVCAYRMIKIGVIELPGSTFIYPLSFFLGNIFAEVYGAEQARRLISESIFCGIVFALFIFFVDQLPFGHGLDRMNEFDHVLGHVLRFTLAGVTGYLVSAYLNVYILTRWKFKMRGRLFWIRSLFAASLSEGVATGISGSMTFLGILPGHFLFYVLSCALIFKVAYGFVAVWPAAWAACWLKKMEARYSQ